MAQSLLAMSLRRLAQTPAGARAFSHAERVGKREIVGYGVNGLPVYVDRVDYPMPAIRFKEDTKEILVKHHKIISKEVPSTNMSNLITFRLCARRRRAIGTNCRCTRRRRFTVPPSVRPSLRSRRRLASGSRACPACWSPRRWPF